MTLEYAREIGRKIEALDFYTSAMSAIQVKGDPQNYYLSKLGEGMHRMLVLNAACNKLFTEFAWWCVVVKNMTKIISRSCLIHIKLLHRVNPKFTGCFLDGALGIGQVDTYALEGLTENTSFIDRYFWGCSQMCLKTVFRQM